MATLWPLDPPLLGSHSSVTLIRNDPAAAEGGPSQSMFSRVSCALAFSHLQTQRGGLTVCLSFHILWLNEGRGIFRSTYIQTFTAAAPNEEIDR